MKKFIIYFRLHWLKIVLFSLGAILLFIIIFFLASGLQNYFSLESFSRKQLSAQMGFFFIIGILTAFIQLPLFFGMHYYFLQGGNLGNIKLGKSKVNVKWDTVIGLEEAKKEAWELVKLLKDRALLKTVGGKIIKGTIMIGPPGCGKTYLAKAIATECGLPLLATVGSDFVGMFVGQGTARMKSLFQQARALAKLEGGCIIFIDEIDSFARPRGADMGFGGGRLDQNATINQFLTEMDGLRNIENNIVIIAATNVPEHELDSAIMRAGRFDRKIHVTRPNLKEREAIFNLYLSKIKADASVNANVLARKTVLFSPAEIESMVREGSLLALRDSRDTVNMKDLSGAYERVSFGQKSNIILTPEEKYSTAYHETGHAILYYLIHPTDDVMKATIVPRGGALGYVFARPTEEVHSEDRDLLLAEIKVSIASYVVERKKFGKTTSGVGGGRGSDFYQAMQTAHRMVWRYGMGKSGMIGDFHALTETGWNNSGYLSEKTKAMLDEDTQDILQSCLKEVDGIITKHWDAVVYFAEELYKKEEIDYDEIETIFTKFQLKKPIRANKNETI